MNIIDELTEVLEARRGADPESSYVASLYDNGLNKILEKVGEEATEVVIAGKEAVGNGRQEALLHEVADLWFHTCVLLVHLEQKPRWVLELLEARFGTSGHTEKANRKED
ncbi:MAG: phosphoribosyl-ATP diphosphatase [Gammaproteobacteria bacterium]|nr:phosphoribosyl-ATP diphosphatase [Gammaproteobacteria bacterium]MCZ6852574.1 phosphoribosyl-ATP diphosphatase [Gammaproteobacteria bacterium]